MPDLKGIQNLHQIALLLVPGIVFLWARTRLITGRMPAFAETAVIYFAITLVYWGALWPIIPDVLEPTPSRWWQATKWLGTIFVVPAILGTLSGGMTREKLPLKFQKWLGIEPVHPAPSAWDRLFYKPRAYFMRVTLADDTAVFGLYSEDSFTSSDGTSRDIYLERTFNPSELGSAITSAPGPGIYIPQDQIKHIEIFPS